MTHHQRAGIGPGDELVVPAAVDLHLLLVEAVPKVMRDDVGALVETLGIVDGEHGVGEMRGLGFRHSRRHALAGQPAPGRRQLRKRLAVAVELARLVGRDVGQAIGAGEAAIKIIEAAVLGVDDDDSVDLVVARRSRLGGSAILRPAQGLPAGSTHAGPMSRAEAFARAETLTALGRQMFFDPSLSASGKQACSSCHDPDHAFGPASASPVEMGGPNLDQPGLRAAPSLRYLQAAPAFTEHFHDSEDEGDESVDNGPTGGLTWDGRVDHGKDQARIPLLSPFEMANKDESAVIAALRRAPYADAFKAAFGADVFDHPRDAFDAAIGALGTFEQSSADFYPYSSRYDAFLAGKAHLTAQELRGRVLFEDETKGNCASCHLSEPANDGEPPQFTDYGLIAIAVPRNQAIPANADPNYFDLGLCGRL